MGERDDKVKGSKQTPDSSPASFMSAASDLDLLPPRITVSKLQENIKNLCTLARDAKSHICTELKVPDFKGVTRNMWGKGKQKPAREFLVKTLDEFISTSSDFFTSSVNINSPPSLDHLGDLLSEDCPVKGVQEQLNTTSLIVQAAEATARAHSQAIEKQLADLWECVRRHDRSHQDYEDVTPGLSSSNTTPLLHQFKHIEGVAEKFVSEEEATKLLQLLNSQEFTSEGSHSVLSFGERYKYSGHKVKPQPTPEIIQQIMDSMNKAIAEKGEEFKVTACLVNKYEGPKSGLSEHSDDEPSVDPESSIATLSLGETCTITFKDRFSGQEIKHTAIPNSLYVMSRESQSVFTHRIDPDPAFSGVRYSLTFRCVSWRYLNSTCLFGASNCRDIVFGEGKGKLVPSHLVRWSGPLVLT